MSVESWPLTHPQRSPLERDRPALPTVLTPVLNADLNDPSRPTPFDHLHVWIPNMFEFKGGIQVYSAFLLHALQDLYPNARYTVCLKHDTQALPGFPFLPHTQYHFAGRVPLPWRTPAFAAQLMAMGVRERPDRVLTTHLNFTEAAYWLKRLTGIPYWAIAHGIEAWNIQKPSLIRALRQAERILAVSGYTRDRLLQELDLNPDQVVLLPNTFDANRFAIGPKPAYLLQRYGLTADQPVILTVARLADEERYKGYDQILRALPQIRQQFPTLRYIVAGKGDDRQRVERLIQDLQVQDGVTLAGFVPDEELGDHYNLCDVFAMPSKAEGFGIVYLEALACGKPTLGGNQDGAMDALCQGELGVLVNPDDVEAIAHTLIAILHRTYPHPLLYQPQALRERVVQTFGFEPFKHTLNHLLMSP